MRFRRIGDRVTVLRDGRKIGTVQASNVEETRLVEMMTGRKIDALFPEIAAVAGEAMLKVRNISTADGRLSNVNFEVRAGEIVGVAGLVGCGKSELARAVFGLEKIAAGELVVLDESVKRPTPTGMLKRGVCYFPSDRVAEGLALSRPVRENASIAALDLPDFTRWRFIRRRRERTAIKRIIEGLRVRPPQIERSADQLSGGNRQKVMLARGLTRDIKVFLFDEPTVGIDVGAKTEVYQFLGELTRRGAAVLLISSELPEVVNLAHRVYVMHEGRIVNHLTGDGITEEAVLASFFGTGADAPQPAWRPADRGGLRWPTPDSIPTEHCGRGGAFSSGARRSVSCPSSSYCFSFSSACMSRNSGAAPT